MRKVLVIGDLNDKLLNVLNRAKQNNIISDFINYQIYNQKHNTDISVADFVNEMQNLISPTELVNNWIVLKGNIHTKEFLKFIIKWENNKFFKPGDELFLSHIAYLSNPTNGFGFYLSDAALNVTQMQDIKTLRKIIENAINYVSKLKNITQKNKIKTAIVLAARNERIPGYNVVKEVIDTNVSNDISLLQFDECFSKDSFINKNSVSESFEFSIPDLLITPDITTGNCIWKSLTILNNWVSMGYLAGGHFDVVVLSRSDSEESYYKSIEFLSKNRG